LLRAIPAGEWEVSIDQDTTRSFGPGELVLFENTTGGGHSSRILADDSLALVVRLA
jgi:hypothetical protein